MLTFTVTEARDIEAILREKATSELADAVGKIHNAKLSRLAVAERLSELADRIEAWADVEQERQNYANSAGVRKMMAARRAAKA